MSLPIPSRETLHYAQKILLYRNWGEGLFSGDEFVYDHFFGGYQLHPTYGPSQSWGTNNVAETIAGFQSFDRVFIRNRNAMLTFSFYLEDVNTANNHFFGGICPANPDDTNMLLNFNGPDPLLNRKGIGIALDGLNYKVACNGSGVGSTRFYDFPEPYPAIANEGTTVIIQAVEEDDGFDVTIKSYVVGSTSIQQTLRINNTDVPDTIDELGCGMFIINHLAGIRFFHVQRFEGYF
jgi:hypothetical protein